MVSHSAPNIDENDLISVNKQLKTLQLAHGEQTKTFEGLLKAFLNVRSLRTTSNGTNAIFLALRALDLPKGSEVILPVYTCSNVYDAVVEAGLKPVLCDIGLNWLVTPDTVNAVISSKSKCIILVHSLGISADTEQFKVFGLPIIEDFCQNLGGLYDNLRVALKGDIGVYSFHATKCITTGEGGALATNDSNLEFRINELCQVKSMGNPLCDIQSALGIAQLAKYPKLLTRRKEIAEFFFVNIKPDLTAKFREIRQHSIFFRFLLWKDDLNFPKLRSEFHDAGISVRKGVDSLVKSDLVFLNASESLSNTLSIPSHPNLSSTDLEMIVENVNKLV